MKNTMQKTCLQCNEVFEKQSTRSRRDFLERCKFCSKKCYNLSMKGVTLSEERKNILFRNHGKTSAQKSVRESTQYKDWRISIFERDNYTCQDCKVKGGKLQADHIKPFAFYPELRFEMSNGRTLCVSCHTKTETYGGRAVSYYKKTLWANAV